MVPIFCARSGLLQLGVLLVYLKVIFQLAEIFYILKITELYSSSSAVHTIWESILRVLN